MNQNKYRKQTTGQRFDSECIKQLAWRKVFEVAVSVGQHAYEVFLIKDTSQEVLLSRKPVNVTRARVAFDLCLLSLVSSFTLWGSVTTGRRCLQPPTSSPGAELG